MSSADKSKKKKKPSHLMTASSVLQGLLSNVQSPLAGPFVRYKIWRYWDEIVGVSVAKISVPVEVDKGRLLVWAKSSAHLQDLHFVAEAIKDQTNKFLGRKLIHSVRFTLDEKRVPPPDAVGLFDLK